MSRANLNRDTIWEHNQALAPADTWLSATDIDDSSKLFKESQLPQKAILSEERMKAEAEPDSNRAASFAEVLCEELGEIERLYRGRRSECKEDNARGQLTQDNSTPAVALCTEHRKWDPENDADQIFKQAHQTLLVGLAFSGGGIRSATFNLGVLQGLANLELLPIFDYLSTVSGGGYVGGWLAAWIYRAGQDSKATQSSAQTVIDEPPAILRVQECLKPDRSSKLEHETPRPLRFLREYSNYLTPRLGFLGADTWAAAAIYIRNLMLNQLILVLFLSSVLVAAHIVVWVTVVIKRWPLPVWSGLGAIILFILVSLWFATLNMQNLTGIRSNLQVRFPFYMRQYWILWVVAIPLLISAWIAASWLTSNTVWNWLSQCKWSIYWPLVGAFGFGLPWALAGVRNLPQHGQDAPHWNSTEAWYSAQGFSLLSGAMGGCILWLLAHELFARWITWPSKAWYVVSFGTPLIVIIFFFVGVLQIGFLGLYFPDPRREWWGRLGGFLLIISIVWVSVFSLTFYSPLALTSIGGWIRKGLTVAWVSTTLAGLLGGKSSSTGSLQSHSWKETALAVTPYVFIVGILSFLAWSLELVLFILNGVSPNIPRGHWDLLRSASNWKLAVLFVVMLVLCLVLSWRVNLNEFSMNLFYRNRIVRAYLGASHTDRNPNPFTGFDPADDFWLKDLRASNRYSGPFPIMNMALNLVGGKDLAWQERKAESFTMTPFRCGFDTWLEQLDLEKGFPQPRPSDTSKYAYRPTTDFGFEKTGFRLGTAISISGAAASPNMGFHSAPSLAFLMTFFDVRLGFWAGNPRNATTWKRPGPAVGLLHLLSELFGHTNDEADYVYLSDGGHFENLGLYELIKRRCKFIIVSDADCDPNYQLGDIGNAVRKCREDVGVEITFSADELNRIQPGAVINTIGAVRGMPSLNSAGSYSRSHWVVGTIRYDLVDPNAEPGILIYLKCSLTNDEPSDVLNYQRQHKDFPHESTTDQWFTESQFESYRRLGEHIIEKLFEPIRNASPSHRVLPKEPTRSDVKTLFTNLQREWTHSAEKPDL